MVHGLIFIETVRGPSSKTENKIRQKKFKPVILLNQTRTEKQMRTAALRHRI